MKKAWIVNASLLLPGVRSSPTSANPRAPPRLQWCPPSLLLIKSDFFDAMEMYAKFLDVRNAIFTVFFTMEFTFTPVWATRNYQSRTICKSITSMPVHRGLMF